MPQLPNEFDESYSYFESLLKDSYGEHKFKRAVQIVEKFDGDRYLERNEKRLIKLLMEEVFKSNED